MLHTILVGTDLEDMKTMETACRILPEIKVVGMFSSSFSALEYAQTHLVEFMLLDIAMPEMNGFLLCEKLRKIRPEMIVVFVTALADFAVDAIHKQVDGVLLKPYNMSEVGNMLARVSLLQSRLRKRVYCRTFGRFDLFIDKQPVVFKSAKAKEILALCVYRQGAPVSIAEIVDKLWEDYNDTPGECSTFRTALKALTDTLKQHQCGDILLRSRGFCHVDTDAVESDYYDFLNNDTNAICEFQGEFMSDYSWSNSAVFALCEKKQQHESAIHRLSR
ncbi:MAG: response regulator [Ruthenibacterium sp.]